MGPFREQRSEPESHGFVTQKPWLHYLSLCFGAVIIAHPFRSLNVEIV